MAREQLSGYTFIGESTAGTGTSMVVRELKLCFDLGVMHPAVMSCDNIFISHAHTDHAGEIFNYLAVRALEKRNMATFFVPPSVGDALSTILSAWQEMAESRFDFRIVKAFPNSPLPLKNRVSVTPFPLDHVPACYGFLVEETVQKLKPIYDTLPAFEIAQRRKSGDKDLFFKQVRPLIAYVPDTLPQGLDQMPEAAWKARVLAVECSFLDDRKPLEKVRKGKHLVLDDILERLDRFQGESILLFHFSRIYKPDEIRHIVEQRLPEEWRDRVALFL